MEGSFIDLKHLSEYKRKSGFLLFVDEAHSIGCLGKTGRGIREYMDCYDVEDEDEEEGSANRSTNPLDEIDVTAFLKKVFQSMSGDVYAQGVIFLSPEQKSKISVILSY